MECKLRWVNFGRVSDPRRAFLPAFGVTGMSDDWYRSTRGVIVISLRTPRSAGENFECTWDHLRVPATSRGSPAPSLGAPTISLGAPTTSMGASGSASDKSRSTSNQCKAVWEKQHLLGNVAGAPGNHSYYLSFNDF